MTTLEAKNLAASINGKQILKDVSFTMHGGGSRLDKLRLFVESLNKMGYSAKLVVEGGSAKIVRYNCIFYDLAKENAGAICGSLGMNIVKGVVGEDFKIKEKFSTGDRKCVVELKL